MTQTVISEQELAQIELSAHLFQQSQDTAQYEIDSIPDIFGTLYRVWGGAKGINLLGTFYQNLDGFWVSQPCYSVERFPWNTSDEAIAAIVNG